jgi:hypothetical protein
VKGYNTAQRNDILLNVKDALADILKEAGAPKEEPKKEEPKKEETAKAKPQGNQQTEGDSSTFVTGGRQSTKVAAPPGGTSQISFGGDSSSDNKTVGRKLYKNVGESSISFGGSDGSGERSSTTVKQAPGGGSSITFGDDGDKGDQTERKKGKSSTRVLNPSGGKSQISLGGDSGSEEVRSSTRLHQAPGGTSQVNLGGDTKPAPADSKPAESSSSSASSSEGSDELSPSLLTEISSAIYRKGKLKATFDKFTANKSKFLNAADLKVGIVDLGIKISDKQAAAIVAKFAKDAKEGLSYADFVRIQSGNQ